MADANKRVSFGRATGWTVSDEQYEAHGIVAKLTISINDEQREALLDYLSDDSNADKYGHGLELTLFEADEDKSFISSGSLQEKYKKKEGGGSSKAKSGRSGGRRSL
ncbi:hypothetical protein [Arthronema virus TR020]|uniref:Uncharacterized protein n=1 Tax=Arthronema virus TR020 TaxID=2736280 RepID=A0A7G3WH41_9CAUD|nr:hypothetical protein [Arthronema virus TR020]